MHVPRGTPKQGRERETRFKRVSKDCKSCSVCKSCKDSKDCSAVRNPVWLVSLRDVCPHRGSEMTTFSATFDANALNRQIQDLSKMNQWAAFARALARAGQSMNKQAIFEVQSVLNLKAGPIREVVRIDRQDRRALVAQLRITGRASEIIDFKGVRQVGQVGARRSLGKGRVGGVGFQAKKTGSRRVIRSAFIATMPSGKYGVFRRRINTATGKPRTASLPIDLLYSTSPRQVLEDQAMQRRILDAGVARFGPELTREVTRRLGGS